MLNAAPLLTCFPMTGSGRCVAQRLPAAGTIITTITVTTRLVRPVVPV